MKSKTSCFNMTIFIKNMTRFWPVWVVYLATMLFIGPFALYASADRYSYVLSNDMIMEEARVSRLEELLQITNISITPVITFFFACIIAVILFSYLTKARECYMMHAFPVKRSQLFLSTFADAVLFMVVPQVIAFVINMIICVVMDIPGAGYMFLGLICQVALTIIFLGMAVFCCMLTANTFAAGLLYIALNVGYCLIKVLFLSMVDMLSYGISTDIITEGISQKDIVLAPIVILSQKVKISYVSTSSDTAVRTISDVKIANLPTLIGYLVFAAVLIVLAYILYKRRQLECAGDIVVLAWTRPIVRWVLAITVGSGLAMIVISIMTISNEIRQFRTMLAFSIIFIAIIFIFVSMILQKSFRIFTKKKIIEGIACVAFAGILIAAVEGNAFGYESRIPDKQDIDVVLVTGSSIDYALTDEADIEKIIDIHKSIIDHKKEYEEAYSKFANQYISNTEDTDKLKEYNYAITYYLKDGSSISRSYSIPVEAGYVIGTDDCKDKILALESDKQYFFKYRLAQNYSDYTTSGGYVEMVDLEALREYGSTYNWNWYYYFTDEEAAAVFEAYNKDVEEGNVAYGLNGYIKDAPEFWNTLSIELNGTQEQVSIGELIPNRDSVYSGIYSFLNPSVEYEYSDTQEVATDDTISLSMYFVLTPQCQHTLDELEELNIATRENFVMYEQISEMNGW